MRLLLAGGGHAHAVVLHGFARRRPRGARITLVSPGERHTYSGMVPGLIAGHYREEDVQIDLRRLAIAAGAEFVSSSVVALDAARRSAELADGARLEYDFASLNVGSLADTAVPGSAEHGLPAKPFEPFIARVRPLLRPQARIAIAGGGVAGLELAMALRHRASCQVSVYSAKDAFNPGMAARLGRALERLGVEVSRNSPIERVLPGPTTVTARGEERHDALVLTTGAAPHAWLRHSGLRSDERGFILVDHTLRSVSHREVFAAGDCATVSGERLPKSGVYAVRQGQSLAANLENLLRGKALVPYRPQRRALSLVSCGDRHAIAEWGNWSAEGAWAWRWKDWIDRRWMARFRGL